MNEACAESADMTATLDTSDPAITNLNEPSNVNSKPHTTAVLHNKAKHNAYVAQPSTPGAPLQHA
jgi:hypothetical protein